MRFLVHCYFLPDLDYVCNPLKIQEQKASNFETNYKRWRENRVQSDVKTILPFLPLSLLANAGEILLLEDEL